MKRGEIYFIKSNNKEEGCEMHANRPAVIVSNDAGNEHSELLEVCYLTTAPKKDLPTHVLTRSCLRPSTIIAEQITTISKTRVVDYIGKLTPTEQTALDNAMAISLGLGGDIHVDDQGLREDLALYVQKLETERDLYRKYSEDLIDVLKKGVRG